MFNIILFLLFFTPQAFAFVMTGCEPCISAGGTYNCNGFSGGTYTHYCGGLGYSDPSCAFPHVCDCPTPPPGDPCVPCGYTNMIGSGNCYSDTLCTTSCSGVPEFPFKIFIPLIIGLPLALLLFRRRRQSDV